MGLPKIKIVSVAFHRNGIFGNGFYTILFDEKDEGRMVASLFSGSSGYCAVYNVNKLVKGDIKAGSNSYRGDVYESVLRPMLEKLLQVSVDK
jgi:hypothetical protein